MSNGSSARSARVVVVGAGFAGASAVRRLPPALRQPGETLLIDRAEEYPFIPLIHEVAAGRVYPESVLHPIPDLCKGRCAFLRAEVTELDPERKLLETSAGPVGYEYLILAAGSGARRPSHGLAEHFQTFWTLEDALQLREALDWAWRNTEAENLTVAIVGGGATGVELAGEVASLFQFLRQRVPRRSRVEPRVVLLEAADRLMGWLDPYFHEVAMQELGKLGVEVRLNTPVEEADAGGVRAGEEWLPARIKVWTTGIEISDLVRDLPGKHDPTGRAVVDARLTLPEHPDVYVPGDAGVYRDPRYGPLPPVASVAVQQGPFIARDLGRRVSGADDSGRPPFDYFNRGYVVSLGPESAVGEAVGVKVRGVAAQLLYRSIFLYYLRNRQDRALVGADWAMERTFGRVGFGEKRQPVPG